MQKEGDHIKVAWIGCGMMGTNMPLNLKKGGHTVSAYNRAYEKATPLLEQGIRVKYTIWDCASDTDVVCTMVGYPRDVEEIYEGNGGIFAHVKAHTALIGFTISSSALVKKPYTAARAKGHVMLNAPVSGDDSGAKVASLSTMTGGDEEVFEQMRPLFSLLGTGIQYMGEARNGQYTETCNQIVVTGVMAAMSETLVYARAVGLDEQKVLTVITKEVAGSWQIGNTAPHVLANGFAPGFYIRCSIKDMHIVQQKMEQRDVHLDILKAVCNMYEALAGMGEENDGTQALVHYYE